MQIARIAIFRLTQPLGRLIHPLHVVERRPPVSAAAAAAGACSDKWRNIVVGATCDVVAVFAFRRRR